MSIKIPSEIIDLIDNCVIISIDKKIKQEQPAQIPLHDMVFPEYPPQDEPTQPTENVVSFF